MNSPLLPDAWIGRSIGDRQRYRLEKRLGSGGMGDVFLAMDTLLGKQVALKLLKDTLVSAEDLRKRFEREVAVCAALKSDHIVEVSDYGVTSEGHPFYVMEYLRGESLGQLLRREKRLSVQRAVSIITQVCEGLRLAHAGVTLWRDGATTSEHVLVIHRDLKPDNIFLVPTALGELVKILDFGIAKICNDTSEHTNLTSIFIGTFHYASPEQLRVAKQLDGRADIYSLGIILYEMLSGIDPFGLGLNTRNISGILWAEAHTSKQPMPLRSQPGCEQIAPELEAVVMRCLQKAPKQRFASVDELKRVLTQIPSHSQLVNTVVTDSQLDSPPTQLSPPPPSTPSSKLKLLLNNAPPSSKFSLLLTGAGIAIAITVTGSTYAYMKWQPVETKAQDEIRAEQAEAKYGSCITKAKTVTGTLSLYVKNQELLNQCQLERANKLAAESNFAEAIIAVSTIPKDSPLYSKAAMLSEQWSDRIITLATAQFQAGKIDTAITQVQVIPATSPAYQKALLLIAQWRKDWQVAETQFNTAKSALDQGKWQVAIDESNKVPNISFWKEKIKPVVEEAQFQIALPPDTGWEDAASDNSQPGDI